MRSGKHFTFAPQLSPGVEIGRQATLRWWCSKGRAGSNPVLGTIKKSSSNELLFYLRPLFLYCLNKAVDQVFKIFLFTACYSRLSILNCECS